MQLPPHDSAEMSTRHTSPPDPSAHSCSFPFDPRCPPLSGSGVLRLYRQARFRSFTCASLLVIMVANTRPKRTLLIST